MHNKNFSHIFISFNAVLSDENFLLSRFILYIYEQLPKTMNNYVFFWQAIDTNSFTNIHNICSEFSLNMYINKKKNKSDYCIDLTNCFDIEVIDMLLKSHLLNTLFVASKKSINTDYYVNSNKNPIANSNQLFDSYDYAIYIDLDWNLEFSFNDNFTTRREILSILKKYSQMNNVNMKIREEL